MKRLTEQQRQELEALKHLPEEAIDTQDVPEQRVWADGLVGKFYRPIKKPVTIRLDADVIAFFQKDGAGYQTKINQVLRKYMEGVCKSA